MNTMQDEGAEWQRAGKLPPRRLSVAPMLDWTDRHYRHFARLITRDTWLYTEMVTTGALLHGDVERHLGYDQRQHPLALQLGGSEPEALARCARLAAEWGYDEINLNVGCPSDRVQKGAFGACLMAEPALVADCVRAMREVVAIDVTVKHRIGIDHVESYGFVRDFVDIVSDAGCRTFIVHARNAILKGLSPKENREIPPLKYHYVHQLKRERPDLEIIINGGIAGQDEIDLQLERVDGVMVGREAYHNPWIMANWDQRYYGSTHPPCSRGQVVASLVRYAEHRLAQGDQMRNLTRHILGLFQGVPGARRWRRMLSDAALLNGAGPDLLLRALPAQYAA